MDELHAEITRAVPQQKTGESAGEMLTRVVAYLEGWRDKDGTLHKGVIDRLVDIEVNQAKAAADREAFARDRLDWRKGLGLAAAGAAFANAFDWFKAHIH